MARGQKDPEGTQSRKGADAQATRDEWRDKNANAGDPEGTEKRIPVINLEVREDET